MSKGSKKSSSSSSVELDPQSQMYNQMILGMLTGSFSPEAMMNLEGQWGDWYNQALGMIDPTAQYQASQEYLDNVLRPQMMNQFAVQGMGRSGAQVEGLANAGAGMTLPIHQQASAQRYGLETMIPQMAQQSLQAFRPISVTGQDVTMQQSGSSMLPMLGMMGGMAAMNYLPSMNASTLFGQGASGMSMDGMMANPGLYGQGAMASPWGTTFPT